jgi:hypothetical protein
LDAITSWRPVNISRADVVDVVGMYRRYHKAGPLPNPDGGPKGAEGGYFCYDGDQEGAMFAMILSAAALSGAAASPAAIFPPREAPAAATDAAPACPSLALRYADGAGPSAVDRAG